MRVISGILFGLGLVLVLGVGASVALRQALPAADTANADTSSFRAAASSGPQISRRAALPQMPRRPAAFAELERRDLRPDAPASLDYTPQVADVTTYRMVDGIGMRRVSAFDGGHGPIPRPVVILFHGASRDELSMIDMWDDTARTHGLVLISLKSDGPSWDPNTDDTDLLARALDLAEEDFPIDRSRVFLFGHSAGSVYAQLLANRGNGPWLAVAGHGGTLPAHWVQTRTAAPPLRHYLGSSDGIFPPFDARQSSQALAAAGHYSELVIIPGHTHWFYEGGPAIAEDAWLWFAEMMADPAG